MFKKKTSRREEGQIQMGIRLILFTGDVGVNLFFLLAGMILYVVYRRSLFTEEYSIWNFYVARFSRMYPSYLMSLVISFQLLYPLHYFLLFVFIFTMFFIDMVDIKT